MRAGLATLDVLEDERLAERAGYLGELLRSRLRERLSGYEMFKDAPGLGLLSGIEFQPPSRLTLRLSYEAFRAIHPGMFGQMLVMRLFRREKILTQVCGNNFMVLKSAPPLVTSEAHLEEFVAAVGRVVADFHESTAFWTDALALGRRTIDI
jgi:ornithine--oxo-acid transaminase